MSVDCCNPKQLPKSGDPNVRRFRSRIWDEIAVEHPTILLPHAVIGAAGAPATPDFIVARPDKRNENTTDVYRAMGSRYLFLYSPGTWQVWNNHTTPLEMLQLDVYDGAAFNAYKRNGYWIPAHTAPVSGVGTTLALAANNARAWALFQNDSANVIYLSIVAAAAVNTGIRINANGGTFEMCDCSLVPHQVNFAAVGGAGSTLLVTEGT